MLQQFISSLIPDIRTKSLIYSGDLTLSKKVIDIQASMSWYRLVKDITINEVYTIQLFWNKITKNILVFNEEVSKKYKSRQNDFNDLLKTYSKWWIISDEFYQILNKLFLSIEVVEITHNKQKLIWFRKLDWADWPMLWQVDIKVWHNSHVSVNVERILPELSQEDYRYSNIALLIKEVSDWFISFKEYSIVNNNGNGTYSQQRFKIWQDLVIRIKWQTVLSVDAKETKFDIRKSNEWMWSVYCGDQFISFSDDFNPINTVEHKDGSLTITLYWAYTHILRNVLSYDPQSWQYKYLMREKRLNMVAWCRRAWKTMHSTYKIFRRMYRNPSSKRHKHRQPKWIYIAPSEDKFKAVLDYIESSSERIKALKILKYNQKTKRLQLSDEVLDKNKKPLSMVVATFDFISAKWYEPWRGNGSDEIIIDEAWYVGEDVFLTLLPIIENEHADLYCISTIDWSTPKHWFYELLTSYEQEWDIEWYAQRVTIDDIDDNIISQSSKERMKKALRWTLQRYYAELYATFPAINAVFGTTHFFVMPDKAKEFEEIIIWYDPAKRSDFWGVVVCGIFTEQGEKRMTIIEEYRLQGDYNPYQKDFLMNLKYTWINKWLPVKIIMDATAAWDVVAEIMGWLIDFKVWYTWTNARPEMDKYGSWKYGKKNLVHMLQILIDTKKVQAFSNLTILIEEMKNFKMIHGVWGNVKYEAAVWHDDIVNASMLCWFYFWFILWQFSTIQYDTDIELMNIHNEFVKMNNLYETYYKRIPYDDSVQWNSYNF